MIKEDKFNVMHQQQHKKLTVVKRRCSYHTNSLDMVPGFYSAGITALDQSHDDTNEEEHLSLLHTNERKKINACKKNTRLLFRHAYCN